MKRELSRKAKLSIYRSIYVPTLTYGHELWVMTERIRSQIRACERSGARSEQGAERAKYSQSAEQVLIQRPERLFRFAPVPRMATR